MKLGESDYHHFLRVADYSGLTSEEKLREIITWYIIIERGRVK